MIFDGGELALNDSVYDVAYGSGSIVELNIRNNSFRVSFGPRIFSYTLDGRSTFARKTLYWREPTGGYIPTKHDANWDLFDKLRKQIATTLGIKGD